MNKSKQKYYFFSGKGGVGKTSLSSATAINFAESGVRTLIITTDPASNLADVMKQPIGHKITAIKDQPKLFAMELDPDQATAEYKERTLAPLRGVLPDSMLSVMEEQLNSPCTAEIATFEKFVDWLDVNDFEIIIFDTAPTGHTLRLLELPGDWSQVITQGTENNVNTCIGPAQALADSKIKFDKALTVLKDPALTAFVFVLKPQASSIHETKRSIKELRALDIKSIHLIANGIIPKSASINSFFAKKRQDQLRELNNLVALDPTATAMYLQERELVGTAELSAAGKLLYQTPVTVAEILKSAEFAKNISAAVAPAHHQATEINLAPPLPNSSHLVFFAGKGGVGKTLVSCATAVDLSDLGYKTLLVTTDPAAHLANILGEQVDNTVRAISGTPNLEATRIDPKAEATKYKEKILSEAKGKYPPDRLAAMEEELNSPCTEEMAVFYRFIDLAGSSEYDYIVFDTAPSGHTLRLLKLPVEWKDQLEIKTYAAPELSEADSVAKAKFDKVIKRMQSDKDSSFIFIVIPEYTPIIEAKRGADQLASIGIKPSYIIANQTLLPENCATGFFAERLAAQEKHLKLIEELFTAPMVQIPLLAGEPQGISVLRKVPLKLNIKKGAKHALI